jgi:[ribosomal protein S18]-alanine N-acetyltransferase
MRLAIDPIASDEERDWCARLMASNEPWITLKRDVRRCRNVLGDEAKERYVVSEAGKRVGLLILDMHGPFPGYLQSICVAPEERSRGIGTRMIEWAEQRIFRDSPNVFMCVSSFNHDAQRLYTRLGYQTIGVLRNFVIDGLDEVLLRKSRGSWERFGDSGGIDAA